MKKIREYRLRANLSQGQLAEKLCVKQPSVSQWERGTAYPGIDTAKKISEILNIPFGLIFDQYTNDGPFEIPVYSAVHANGESESCSKPGCVLKVTEEELRMLVPRSEISELGLGSDEKSRVDPGLFFGYYCESGNMAPTIQPDSVNLLYRTNKILSNAIHLVSMDGKDGYLVRLIKNDRGILVIMKGPSERYRYFRYQDAKNGTLLVHGLVVETRKAFLY